MYDFKNINLEKALTTCSVFFLIVASFVFGVVIGWHCLLPSDWGWLNENQLRGTGFLAFLTYVADLATILYYKMN